jgi:hypothetical protein
MSGPYAALGLLRNPFVCDDPRALPDHLWLERGLPEPPAPATQTVIQVIGVRGAGKTSLLSRWHAATRGVYHWVPPTLARWQPLPCAPVAYWDEADRVPPLMLMLSLVRAQRSNATVVLGTHRDLTRWVKRAGLEARTEPLPPPCAASVMAWATLRIAAASFPGVNSAQLTLDAATAERVVALAGGSWRVVGDLLHAWAADASASGSGVESLT